MTAPPTSYYRFRSRARYLRARGDFLGWYLAHDPFDETRPFDLGDLAADLPPDSPLITALDSLPEDRAPRTLDEALKYLRVCIHLAEQEWPPAESLETTLAATRPPVPLPAPTPAAEPPEPIAEMAPPEPAPKRPSRWRWVPRLVGLLLVLVLAWGAGRAVQTGIQRHAIAANLRDSLPDLQVSLAGLSLSLPAQAAACIEAKAARCRMDARGPSYGARLKADLMQAQDAASRMLADLSPLAASDSVALWFVAAAGENCALSGADVLDSDRRLVSGLCRIRERLTEYDLCLSGHPAISDRQCADLMRLAIADTLFDCTNCAERPANVFDPRIEWSSELEDAAALVRDAQRFASPLQVTEVSRLRVTLDALWLRDLFEVWRAQTFR